MIGPEDQAVCAVILLLSAFAASFELSSYFRQRQRRRQWPRK